MQSRSLRLAVLLALGFVSAASEARAQGGVATGFGPAVVPLPRSAIGLEITKVTVEVSVSSGDDAADASALEVAEEALSALVGKSYRPALLDASLGQLVGVGKIRTARHQTIFEGAQGGLGIVVLLDLSPTPAPEEKPGIPPFTELRRETSSLLSLIVNAGVGVYSDSNGWFGAPEVFLANNPLAGALPDSQTAWAESFVEIGLGGAAQIGNSPFYVFGAGSGMITASRGQDIFTDEDRDDIHPDKGYVGILYANPENGDSAQLSFGRQVWTLNDGFLISMIAGSSNAGERGATYLGPRNTTDFSALFHGEFGRSRFAFFFIDPDELEDLESNTTYAGANFGFSFTDALSIDASAITIAGSDATYRTATGEALARDGTTTFGAHLRFRPKTDNSLFAEAEAYRQGNDAYDMKAHAYYASLGYIHGSAGWSPSVSYRYASFSGDDPETDTFERFDSMMSTGLGIWLQGLSFGKVYRNGNLNTHRIQANVAPRERMNVTFTWHRLQADETNNLGGNPALAELSSRSLGNEYTGTVRWGINQQAFLQMVASRAVPGEAIRNVGGDDTWNTLQASLYVGF